MLSSLQVLKEIAISEYSGDIELKKLSELANRQLQRVRRIVELTEIATRITAEILHSKPAKLYLQSINAVDNYTAEHCINTCFFSIVTGALLGYRDNDLYTIGKGALLHDAGKIKIPAKILNKKGRLSDEEMAVVRRHPILGYKLAKRETFGKLEDETLSIILQHHERCDGSGYPNGLTRQDIHPFSLIVATADVFDAVTTNRVYQKARSIPEGAKLILQLAGKGELAKEIAIPFITEYVGYFAG